MKTCTAFLVISLLISIVCLSSGYIQNGYWETVPVLLTTGLILLLVQKRSSFWIGACILLAAVFLASIGMIAGFSPVLMITASTFALVSWDLVRFNQSLDGTEKENNWVRLEKHHLRVLVMAISAGLVIALAGAYIDLHISLVGIIMLVLLALGGLVYSTQQFLKKER